MLKIAVCDEEILMTSKIEKLLLDIGAKRAIDIDVDVFFDGRKLEKNIDQGEVFDLIYLDIEMKKRNGIETAKGIRLHDPTVVLIYVSSSNTYMKELLEVEPFRILDKPVDNKLFEECFLKAYDKILGTNAHYEFKFRREVIKVPLNEILYFESSKRTIFLITQNDTFKFYGKLSEVEKNVEKSKYSFLRIHQSYLVNYKYVKKIGYNYTELIDGTILHISEDRQKWIRNKYCNLRGSEVIG